ncbi:MAG: hypothetical protein MUF44_15215 [Hydrogenophaga sp.]|nr:hypothetical protein [Hydrogenophaga sp.]
MSCCQRDAAAPSHGTHWPAAAAPPLPATPPPLRMRFVGARALSLPVGARRVLALPGEEVSGLSETERLVLWRTGLFEPVG